MVENTEDVRLTAKEKVLQEIELQLARYRLEAARLERRQHLSPMYFLLVFALGLALTVMGVSSGYLVATGGRSAIVFFILLGITAYFLLYQPSRDERLQQCQARIRKLTREKAKLAAGLSCELEVVQVLRQLPQGYLSFADLELPLGGRHIQIDHIVISPHGIIHLETKSVKGLLLLSPNGWQVVRATHHRLIKEEMIRPLNQVRKHERALSTISKKALPGRLVPLASAIVIANPEAIVEGHDQELTVLRLQDVIGFITGFKLEDPLSPVEVQKLGRLLVEAHLSRGQQGGYKKKSRGGSKIR